MIKSIFKSEKRIENHHSISSGEVIAVSLLFSALGILTPIQYFHNISLVILSVSAVDGVINKRWTTLLKYGAIFSINMVILILYQQLSRGLMISYAVILLLGITIFFVYKKKNKIPVKKTNLKTNLVQLCLTLLFVSFASLFSYIMFSLYFNLLKTEELVFHPYAVFLLLLPTFSLGIFLCSQMLLLPFEPFTTLSKIFDFSLEGKSENNLIRGERLKQDRILMKKLLVIAIFINIVSIFLANDEYYHFTEDKIKINPIWNLKETVYDWNEVEKGEVSVSHKTSKTGEITTIIPILKVYVHDDIFTFQYDPLLNFDGADDFLGLISLMQAKNIEIDYIPIPENLQVALQKNTGKRADLTMQLYSTQIK
ncbi:hypothetical protein IPG41_06560 [Candidatus Peregrinibacteria bacterium]|nr:MAG: hypothetical protein IPG41_06560 [Candidatus Peregrinibacteria bacterium]